MVARPNVRVLFVINCSCTVYGEYGKSMLVVTCILIADLIHILVLFGQDMQHFPRIQVRLKIQKKESNGGKIFTLNIRLEDANTQRRTAKAFTPRYPKVLSFCLLCILELPKH